MRRADNLNHLHVSIIWKSGSLNLLETSGLVQACNGNALPFTFPLIRNSHESLPPSLRLPTPLPAVHDKHSPTFAIKTFSLLRAALWDRHVKEESRRRCHTVKVSTHKNNKLRVNTLLRTTNEQDIQGFKRIHKQPSLHKFVYDAPSLLYSIQHTAMISYLIYNILAYSLLRLKLCIF